MTKCYSDLLEPYEGGQYKMYLEKNQDAFF